MTPEKLRETLGNAILAASSGRVTVLVESVLAALRDAGLAIVPKEADDAKRRHKHRVTRGPGCGAAYRAMLSAGDLLGERGS